MKGGKRSTSGTNTISKHSVSSKDGLFVDRGQKGTSMGSSKGCPKS